MKLTIKLKNGDIQVCDLGDSYDLVDNQLIFWDDRMKNMVSVDLNSVSKICFGELEINEEVVMETITEQFPNILWVSEGQQQFEAEMDQFEHELREDPTFPTPEQSLTNTKATLQDKYHI